MEESGKVYGYRKLHDDLLDHGETSCPDRAARLTRLAGTRGYLARRPDEATMYRRQCKVLGGGDAGHRLFRPAKSHSSSSADHTFNRDSVAHDQSDIPFGAILRNWLERRDHGSDFAPGGVWLTEAARQDLSNWRLTRLADLAAPVLLKLFEPRRTLPPLATMTARTPPTAPRAAHDRFVAEMNEQGLDQGLADWPLLLDWLHRMAEDSAAAMSDFLRHVEADRKILSRIISGWRAGVPIVVGAQFGLSDPHGGGRTVARVAFADGTVLAYKPRSLAADNGFSALLEAVNAAGGAPRQRVPLVVDRGDHGWMEWITPSPMRHRRDAMAFYRRCGGLLALVRALRGGDIHPDNLIAAGSFPVILDLECLFQPGPADLGMADPLLDPIAYQAGITPVFSSFDGGQSMVPIAAAGAGIVAQRPQRRIVHVGTDWIHEAEWPVPAFEEAGPVLDGRRLNVRDFADQFAEGYRRTLAVMARRQSEWWAKGGPLDRLARAEMRFLAAPTNLYALVLEHLRQPEVLSDRSALAHVAGRLAVRQPTMVPGKTWSDILSREADAIARHDVPAFRYRPKGRPLRDAMNQPAGRLPGRAMAERVFEDLSALTPQRIREEAALLEASLAWPRPKSEPPPAMSALDALTRLTDNITELAVPADKGLMWVRMWEQMPALVAPAGPSLCYGSAGIAVALAAAARAKDDDRLAELARHALTPWTLRWDPGALAGGLGPVGAGDSEA